MHGIIFSCQLERLKIIEKDKSSLD